jgi:uncharacterized protein YbjT (DUF2867 family)
MNTDKTILVTGATGKQGGAVVRHLLERGFNVRALTRNISSSSAMRLKELGTDLVAGDFDNLASLDRAMVGVTGVFSVQDFMQKNVGYEGEVRQGKHLVDAAKRANVLHFVQASIADCDKAPGVMHFESKWEIEKYVDAIGLPRTFLGAVFFMENFIDPQYGAMTFPLLSGVLKKNTQFHMLSVEDIGAIAARVFEFPDQFVGKKIDMAGDLMTIPQMKAAYQEEIGKKPKSFKLPSWLVRIMDGEIYRQLKWNNDPGWSFDINAQPEQLPKLTNFRHFLRKHKTTML